MGSRGRQSHSFGEVLHRCEERNSTPTADGSSAQAPTVGRGEVLRNRHGKRLHDVACGLRDAGRWEEAEPLFREALAIFGTRSQTPVYRSTTLWELVRGLIRERSLG